jgi:uncharacterized protein (TIGR02594 family)
MGNQMNIPKKYEYLLAPDMPLVIQAGLKMVGTKEIYGAKHSPIIMGWAETAGISKIYTNDELAWCGLSHYVALLRGGKPAALEGWDILRALKYATYGMGVKAPGVGDTLVFERPGGGHVGFYVAESKTTYHVMGGNQSNEYGFTEISKDRLNAARRPIYNIMPPTVKPMFIDASGRLSTNEA